MFHSEAQYENHDSTSPRIISLLALECLPIISGRLNLCAAQMIYMWNEAKSRMDAYPSVVGTLGGGGLVG